MYSEKILNKHIFINMHVSAYVCVISRFFLFRFQFSTCFEFFPLSQFDFHFLVDFNGFLFDFSS